MNKQENNEVKNGYILRGEQLGRQVIRKLFLRDKSEKLDLFRKQKTYWEMRAILQMFMY